MITVCPLICHSGHRNRTTPCAISGHMDRGKGVHHPFPLFLYIDAGHSVFPNLVSLLSRYTAFGFLFLCLHQFAFSSLRFSSYLFYLFGFVA